MTAKLIKIETRNGPAWILPQYNTLYYTTQVAQILWANRFVKVNNKEGK